MTAYDLMIKTNHHLIKGGQLTDAHKVNITRQLFAARHDGRRRPKFMQDDPNMYPQFFIPPFNDGKKLQTVIPMSPKTQILSANSYELEIIRLLHMFAQNNSNVAHMVSETIARLKRTCFGYKNCIVGECFESGILTLRFLSTVAPGQTNWIQKQVELFNSHYADKRRHSGVLKYFWLCLSEMPADIAKPEIARHRDEIVNQLAKSKDDVLTKTMQNALVRL